MRKVTILSLSAATLTMILVAACVGDESDAVSTPTDAATTDAPVGSDASSDGATADGASDASTTDAGLALQPNDPVAIAAGSAHACVVLHNGNLYCWGKNQYGETGQAPGATSTTLSATVVPWLGSGSPAYAAVTAGLAHTCAVTSSGSAYCFGFSSDGELGNPLVDAGAPADAGISAPTTPLTEDGLTIAKFGAAPHSLAASDTFTCGVFPGGTALGCWGISEAPLDPAQTGTKQLSRVPTFVIDAGVVHSIASGAIHTCVSTDGPNPVLCWGGNKSNQSGSGFSVDGTPIVPAVWSTMGKPSLLTAGILHTCALVSGVPYCWGGNTNGQTGQPSAGASDSTATPTEAHGLEVAGQTVVDIASGGINTCAVLSDGTVRCVGENHSGQLGTASYDSDAGATNGTALASVVGIDDAVAVAVGGLPVEGIGPAAYGGFACAIRQDKVTKARSVWCWGANDLGQLGTGTTTSFVSAPSRVTGLP